MNEFQTRQPAAFPATSWCLVRGCQAVDEDLEIRAHLQELVSRYWFPVYSFIYRNWGRNVEQSEDWTQEFFMTFLEKDWIQSVDADKGRFRTFVLVALKRFLGNQVQPLLSIEALRVENSHFEVPEAAATDTSTQFDDDWRRAVIETSSRRLRQRCVREKKSIRYELFAAYDLVTDASERPTYQALAERFQVSESQVTNGIRWSRLQLKELILNELRDQVASEEDLREEAWHLFQIRVGFRDGENRGG